MHELPEAWAHDSPQGTHRKRNSVTRAGEGGVSVRSLDLVLGAEGTPAEEFKQDCCTQLVFLKEHSFQCSVGTGWGRAVVSSGAQSRSWWEGIATPP